MKFNEHILLVMRWLQNKDSVSQAELYSNYNAAIEIYRAANANAKAAAKAAAYVAATAAKAAAYVAATAAKAAEYWINETKESLNAYFKLVKEDRKAYEERAKYLNVLGANNG